MQYRTDSFLINAQMRDTQFLGMNPLPKITANSGDKTYIIDTAYDQRPDLAAYRIYGTSRYWWVFAQRNPDIIMDPIRDFRAGTIIMIPNLDLLRNT